MFHNDNMKHNNETSVNELQKLFMSDGAGKLADFVSALLPDAVVFLVDKNRNVQFWSKGAEKHLGYTANYLIGKKCLSGIRCVECVSGCGLSQSAKIENYPITLYSSEGIPKDFHKYAIAFEDDAGEFNGGLEVLFLAEKVYKQPNNHQIENNFGLISNDPEIFKVFDMIRKVSQTDLPVLVRGESGTGKELVARAIHDESPRKNNPFIAINCAALNASLLESELFGHVKGAFTGAFREHLGVFDRARGGSLFLDEIAEIPIELQAKLLRVLETGEYTPLGGEKSIISDVRIISATHRALREEAKKGKFRQDLLYRLRVVPIFIPNLRSRPADIPLIANHILKQYFDRKQVPVFSKTALNRLMNYAWLGNIRELRNVVHYASIMSDGKVINESDLPPDFASKHDQEIDCPAVKLKKNVLTTEAIADALKRAHGNLNLAASLLDISRTSLWRYRKNFNI